MVLRITSTVVVAWCSVVREVWRWLVKLVEEGKEERASAPGWGLWVLTAEMLQERFLLVGGLCRRHTRTCFVGTFVWKGRRINMRYRGTYI